MKNGVKIIILVLIILVLFLTIKPIKNRIFDSLSSIYTFLLVDLANQDRSSLSIAQLKINHTLENAAQMKADDMAKRGYFSHNTPEGNTPWYWIEKNGYEYKYAGENLAVNFLDSEEVHRAWQNSPTHWFNIINPKYTEIGIATSVGFYKGREAVFVVQMFATPNF